VAAHLSALDYFGEVPWEEFPPRREWYVRLEIAAQFRSLLRRPVAGPAAGAALCRNSTFDKCI